MSTMEETVVGSRVREDFEAMSAASRALWERALDSLPGGNSRTTILHDPFIFVREMIGPARSAPRGVARVWALLDGFLDLFVGGCFFATTSTEFKNRPGPVCDRILERLESLRLTKQPTV